MVKKKKAWVKGEGRRQRGQRVGEKDVEAELGGNESGSGKAGITKVGKCGLIEGMGFFLS